MKRRTFVKSAIGLAALASANLPRTLSAAPTASSAGTREYYELRHYRLGPVSSVEPLHQFLRAAIPILNGAGVAPIGVFTEIEPKGPETIFALLTYPSLEVYARTSHWLRNNEQIKTAAAGYLNVPKDKPSFERIDSWLLLAFSGMPKIELPSFSKERKPRIFELRTYESHSELKAARKIDMFNDGEMDVMRQVGLNPVFYGEALVGQNLPHLTYMTSAEDHESHKKHWDAFGKHPVWDKMKNDPKYADTVSKITKWFLKPTDYSQI